MAKYNSNRITLLPRYPRCYLCQVFGGAKGRDGVASVVGAPSLSTASCAAAVLSHLLPAEEAGMYCTFAKNDICRER